MTDRELMQQALDALIWTTGSDDFSEAGKARSGAVKLLFPAIEIIRARLAQPDREWRGLTTAERKTFWNLTKKPSDFAEMIEAKLKERNHTTPQ